MDKLIEVKLNEEGTITAFLHEPKGIDNLIATSFMAKIGFTALEDLMALSLYKSRFGMCMALTDRIEGMPFNYPARDADTDAVTESFMAWLELPEDIFKRWFQATEDVKGLLNNPALLPVERVPEELSNDPLPSSSAKSKLKGSTGN